MEDNCGNENILADHVQIFDMFFTHERGRMVAIYIFFQQLGSILGLILGGYISDGIGWRWSSPIVAIACVRIRHLSEPEYLS